MNNAVVLPPRIFVLLARQSSKAIIFRRGPSNKVGLFCWDRSNDAITPGQWLHGRIYERRCDLSPRGDYLIYFAAKFKEPKNDDENYYSWTAISKPPYLTALLLWPKTDCWGGGGLFENQDTVLLNHNSADWNPGARWSKPKNLIVKPIGEWAGRGEDSPIEDTRLQRDGWKFHRASKNFEVPKDPDIYHVCYPPHVLKKDCPSGNGYLLYMRLLGLGKNGPWYIYEFEVTDGSGKLLLDLGRADWAEWDANGDLLYGIKGKLFRLPLSKISQGISAAIELADLGAYQFRAVACPDEFKTW